MSVPPSEGPAPAGRRRIVMLPHKVLTPVALIAREGEERDALEQQLTRARPVVAFPSLAHFCTDSTLKERWAGILLARTHAWDSRLDDYVPRRAFIALYGLTDEGYGWPDAVKRIGTPEELEAWLTLLASPTLPEDDKPRPTPRVVRPRKERTPRISIALAPVRAQVREEKPEGSQLALPIAADADGAAGSAAPSPAAPSAQPEPRRGTKPPAPAADERGPKRGPRKQQEPEPAVAKEPARRAEQLAFDGSLGEPPARSGARSPAATGRGAGKRGAPADGEAIITRVALELGFARAEQLLGMVRERAYEIAKQR
jgi:hypothetical protein